MVNVLFFLVFMGEGIEDQRLFEILSQNRDESSTLTEPEGPSMSLTNSFNLNDASFLVS